MVTSTLDQLLSAHFSMVLLQIDQLLPETLHLHLQVRAGVGEVVQNLAQAADVPLHRHACSHLILKPAWGGGNQHPHKLCYHQQP